ncbi:hypothetical protein EXU57_10810 [Segetibacter sp. 3557_3]|uniref:hypothetical protein n=1 Tax=Segetibacter sp. 3557_3 TaxID=2547429 RepID=UPI0010583BA1|nr:hypothetical protein [Segetibacter sp. 3557_3]TDH26572.1 hypothetical protein EXU57_10810 [Segetibacter sp. 3557_3]
MLHVDDHIDDLFRRAAEDYPLNTDGADFNKVMTRMEGDQDDNGHKRGNNKNFLHFLWLLLLLPLPWLCNEEPGEKGADQLVSKTTEVKSNPVPAENTPVSQPVNPNTNRSPAKAAINNARTYTIKQQKPGPHHQALSSRNKLPAQMALNSNKQPALPAAKGSIRPSGANTLPIEIKQDDKIAGAAKPATDTILNQNNGNTPVPVDSNAAAEVVIAGNSLMPEINKTKRFYAGVLVGTDISFIEFQKVKDPGISIGLVAGYAINKRLAVEASAFLEKKSYFSTGEYFDKQRTSIPANYKIENVWGKCNMIDISLNGRYNAIVRPQANWFVTAGVSSYIMKKEDYYYTYRYNWQIMQRRLTYRNSTNNFLAMANLGIGYSGKFQGDWQFRVEPYVKLPLTGIGIGNMRLMSAGVNAGFVKPLF